MTSAWDDDTAFKNISENKFVHFKRLSWQCSQLLCDQCDGFIHYKFKLLKPQVFNMETGKTEDEIIDFEWDTDFESVMIDGGQNQNIQNTPEGSKCECHHCHIRKAKVNESIDKSKYKQRQLSKKEKEDLR